MTLDDDCNVHDKHLENKKIIEDLEVQLDELKFVSNNTKEYLFVLESQINKKKKKINSLKKDIKKKNKELKSLKKDLKKVKNENKELKLSTSWKITSPLRKLFRIFRK